MTQRDNCGSRLLQPLVSVTKIGTQRRTVELRRASVRSEARQPLRLSGGREGGTGQLSPLD
ncbi:hypothetical protein D4764_01G0000900 [Takifugu flavidus]|uniref:Uncharacterized protein n=1 Tax=Takifugu flavidus TaxID=433684 RepID=A0A5C6PLE3_9TELE|nr:hypothetical protein D4764_01G0000900 [Takifugu flavidus]